MFQKLIQTEFAFDPDAKSFRGAMGLGQLMPATVKELGLNLKEDHLIRFGFASGIESGCFCKVPEKIFAKYTKEGIPGEEAWNFEAGAYNVGMGNIAKAIEKVGMVKLWKYSSLSFEWRTSFIFFERILG